MANEITIESNEDIQTLVVRLLGRGLRSEVLRRGYFKLELNDVVDLHSRLIQRVASQNQAQTVDFYCKFTFDDGSQDTLPDQNSFSAYRYMGNRSCVAFELNYSFLIKFGLSDYRKQQLTITANTDGKSRVPNRIFDTDDDVVGGYLYANIEHTDYTWKNDIEHIFIQYTREHLRNSWDHKIVGALATSRVTNLEIPIFIDCFVFRR